MKVELEKFGPSNFDNAVNRTKNIEICLNNVTLNINTIHSQPASSHSQNQCQQKLLEYPKQLEQDIRL